MPEEKNEATKRKGEGSGFLVPIAIVIAGMLVAGAVLVKDSSLVGGRLGSKESQKAPEEQLGGGEGSEEGAGGEAAGEEAQAVPKTTIGNFSVFGDREICTEDGKPLVYYFGSESCPHCRWEEPVVKEVMAQFGDAISFHNNMDSQEDAEVMGSYQDFNPGYIPFLVFGCRYARTGSGEQMGEEAEKKNLTALVCKLTDGKPVEVCESVADLMAQIE